MVSFSFLAVVSLIAGALVAPEPVDQPDPSPPTASVGLPGYFWYQQSEGGSNVKCDNMAGGRYSTQWSGEGGFICGKGWRPGASRSVKYSGSYNATGPSYLGLYGWTRNPLIEYYIIDSYGDLAPDELWTMKGKFTFEEGTYVVYTSTRIDKPSIEGTKTFQQYWSVRTEKRVGGIITTGRHFNAWGNLGMSLGSHDYMILATRGYADGALTNAGSSNIMVE